MQRKRIATIAAAESVSIWPMAVAPNRRPSPYAVGQGIERHVVLPPDSLKFRSKPVVVGVVVVVEPVATPELTRVVSYDKPAVRSTVKLINPEDAGKLWEMLREEKKVI